MVSSPDQIAYFQQLVRNMQPGSAWEKRFVELVERMQREPDASRGRGATKKPDLTN